MVTLLGFYPQTQKLQLRIGMTQDSTLVVSGLTPIRDVTPYSNYYYR